MSKHTINHPDDCRCTDCMIVEFDASWLAIVEDVQGERPWSYCPDCDADEYMRRTDCCNVLRPWCNTVERCETDGTIDVVECRPASGCHYVASDHDVR